jgi:Putative MetA-pathway of phenol degradation
MSARRAPMRVAVQTVMVVGLLLLARVGTVAYAQDLEPRAYVNTPVGLNFLIAGYGYLTGGVATDPSLPLENAHLHAHTTTLAYARALDVWGTSGKVDVIVPYAWLSGSAEVMGQPREREVSGFADPRLRFSVNLYGAPALTLPEFASYKQDLIIGASLQVSAPLGQYDADKVVNIGTNRWSFKPEVGISKAVGPLTLELTTGVTLYTDNHDFFGGKTRAQAPIYSVQGHVSYTLGAGIWVAVDGTYYTGGRTAVDGVEGNDLQKNTRLGVTVALPVHRHTSVKLYGSTGVSTRTGSDFDAVGILVQYRWGGGL